MKSTKSQANNIPHAVRDLKKGFGCGGGGVRVITGIHHFSIIASSDESIAFYTKLGFREYKRIERKYDTVVLMIGHGLGLEVFVDPSHPPRAVKPENMGLRNVALRVDKIEETVEELGVEAGPIMTDWVGVKFCFIVDPDGLPVQLHE